MMQTCDISVIIPCYNVEEYIGENLQTVMDQTCLPLEVICVDDGSSDRTVAIIEGMMAKHPGKITLVRNESNKGAPYSRNSGMSLSKAKYLQFLDADDLLFPDKFEHQMAVIKSLPEEPDILVSSFSKVFLDGHKKEYINAPMDKWAALIDNKIGVTSANLFKKSKVEEVEGWSEYLKSSQEYDLMFRMLKKDASVHFDIQKVNINRERPSGSITKSNPKEKWKRYIDLRIRIYEYLVANQQLTAERELAFTGNLLNAVRTLYRYDSPVALQYYAKFLKGKSLPVHVSGINPIFRLLYNLFGFNIAQKISLLAKGEKIRET